MPALAGAVAGARSTPGAAAFHWHYATAITRLYFISQLTKNIHLRTRDAMPAKAKADDSKDYEQYFPELVWVLRDFALGE